MVDGIRCRHRRSILESNEQSPPTQSCLFTRQRVLTPTISCIGLPVDFRTLASLKRCASHLWAQDLTHLLLYVHLSWYKLSKERWDVTVAKLAATVLV